MKTLSKIMFIVVLGSSLGCQKTERSLYDQVMDIHDEVMPKMNDLYKLKKHLQDSIAKTADITEDQKREMEQTIQELDSASKVMMVWMREFNPPDQKDKETFNKYMESELVKVKKMQEQVMTTLEKAKSKK